MNVIHTFAAGFLLLTLSSSLALEDWPSWRGPSHQGSRAGDNYPTEWSGDKILWKVELPGKGASCPAVWKDRIFLTTPDDGVDTVLAFDRDGKQVWETQLGAERPPKHKKLGTSSNASPAERPPLVSQEAAAGSPSIVNPIITLGPSIVCPPASVAPIRRNSRKPPASNS